MFSKGFIICISVSNTNVVEIKSKAHTIKNPAQKDKKDKETATKTPTKNKTNKKQSVKDKESKEEYIEVMEQEEVSSTPSKEILPRTPQRNQRNLQEYTR